MSTLNVLLTHQDAAQVQAQLAQLRALAPQSRFVVCHGGREREYDQLADSEKAFVADPSLRDAPRSFQSYNETLAVVARRWLRDEPQIDSVYLFEFDHLILRADFEQSLRELAQRTGGGLLAKGATVRNGTNWHHYARFRRDPSLLELLSRVSVREDPTLMYGMFACAIWLSRAAIESYLQIAEHPRCYGELYVPTLLHHLGHRIVDVDEFGDLYRHVRWSPEYDAADARALRERGAAFLHPVKDAGVRLAVLGATGEALPVPAG